VRIKTAVLLCCLSVVAAKGTTVFVTSLAALGANDSATWDQLGSDQTILGSLFSGSTTFGAPIAGSFANGAGSIISVVCPAAPSCSWIPSGLGFSAGDSLIVTSNSNGGATGPLSLGFTAAYGAGLEIQVDIPGTYTAQIQAFNGVNPIGTFAANSNANGDPMFIGVSDTIPDITSITVGLTACGGLGCDTNDFAVDTLFLQNTPEPASTTLFGGGLLALLAWRMRRNPASKSFLG
jgi:hypothetical protein